MAETFKDTLTTANTAREVKIWCRMYAIRGDLAAHRGDLAAHRGDLATHHREEYVAKSLTVTLRGILGQNHQAGIHDSEPWQKN